MILFLIMMILLLTAFSIFLILRIISTKESHKIKISELQDVIFTLLEEQKLQSKNLKLSDELKNKLKEARIAIDENIMELQYDLVSIVSENNLLK